MFNMEKFAQLLAQKRREKGLTQDQLSELVGVTHQAVSKWERGEAMPDIGKIGDIAKALNVPADELINMLYENDSEQNDYSECSSADKAYFALSDKTNVGELYVLAPELSKSTLRIAIDTLISAKGINSASMLFRFADKAYLSQLANQLIAAGDGSLAEYADETVLKKAIVGIISTADMCSDVATRDSHYAKAGDLLAYCSDVNFINEMFEHMVNVCIYWKPWRNCINKFPAQVIIKQGIKMAVKHGTGCFRDWWHIIGVRNAAEIYLGYINSFEKNNYRAWADVAMYFNNVDGSIIENAIIDALTDEEINPEIFRPFVYLNISKNLRDMLEDRGISNLPVRIRKNIEIRNISEESIRELVEYIKSLEGRLDEMEDRLTDCEDRIDDLE